jgi:predicted AAA+ superfamily ATPase
MFELEGEVVMLKPWREIAVPHSDVLKGTFQQAEFAADITAVREGKAGREYQDATAFFQRTFITEGMRLLLTQVAERLNGQGGEPVVQLQTAFGGGKTHTLLAVYHLATRTCPLSALAGVPALLDQAKLLDVPKARVAVIDGTALAPGQPWKRGASTIHTLWGELAWQLGGDEAYDDVRGADESGTSPGKAALRDLLARHAPCVVLIDELVAYVRQFADGQVLSGGTYESNLSFVQALTEAVKLVPNAILLASLPESDTEAAGPKGAAALASLTKTLKGLEKTVGRVQALWKPVATEEAYEIVRRRLFEPIGDESARAEVCSAFAKAYQGEGAKLPSETRESSYQKRLVQAYPIHPEVFERLFEDWSSLESFQRTRGVLKLMARVVHKLWADENLDMMILPGSLPLADSGVRDELLYHLPPGWDAVVEKDIDGGGAETTALDTQEPRFGAVMAARRVARTLFLGTAPASGGSRKANRGIDRGRVLLGCLQPNHASAAFSDALNRLCDKLHYLGTSGDKANDATQFWFDTRANLRREMEDRRGRFDDATVRSKIAEVLKKVAGGSALFDGVHVFTPHSDVPDDVALRLIFLGPDSPYLKQDAAFAEAGVLETVRSNGNKPRYRGNRLIFVAADAAALPRLRDAVRTALAWRSIVDDVETSRLNVDRLQEAQARKELDAAEGVVPRAARETFKWVLCPAMLNTTDRDPRVEAFPLNTGGSSFGSELDRVCQENELVIATWSPIHLRTRLVDLYWKDAAITARAAAVWEDMQRYLYMPRLKNRSVLEQAIIKGAGSSDFFGTAYGQTGEKLEGLKLGDPNVQLDDTLLLVEPNAAAAIIAGREPSEPPRSQRKPDGTAGKSSRPDLKAVAATPGSASPAPLAARSFFGAVDVSAATSKMKLVSIAEDVIALLASDPNGTVTVSVEINATFEAGAPDHVKRAVSENAAALGFKVRTWE